MKPIRNLILLLTDSCNCACPYCFEARSPEHMSEETAAAALDFVQRNAGDRSGLTFFGGEPMLEFDRLIVPTIARAEASGTHTRFAMTTNGTLLTPERVDYLAEHGVRYMLSFDGDRPTQERSRPMRDGGSSFDRLMAVLPHILDRAPDVSVRATLIAENVPRFFDDILFFETQGVRDFSVLPNFFETWDDSTRAAFLRELSKYNRYIVDKYRAGERPLLIRAYRAAFYEIPLALRTEVRRTSANCLTQNQCGFGQRGGASCDVRGNLYGCHHVPMTPESSWCIGNIFDGVDPARVAALVEGYTPERVGNDGCASCPIDKICNGGCVSNNYVMRGDVHRVPEGWCFWRQSIASAAHEVMQTLGREGSALFLQDFRTALNGRAVYG